MSAVLKLAEHVRRQMLARCLSVGSTDKLARIQTMPLFEVAMDGKAAVFGKKAKRTTNLPQLKKAA